ncbi:MAG: TonB family protein [Deltaproteobacteria bacterium]|nr:TonB family protein [Deltaproteobacteria bacterium]
MNVPVYTVWRPKNICIMSVFTLVINALLFMGLPALTRIADRDRDTKTVSQYMLAARDTPRPHEEQKEKRLRQKELKQIPATKITNVSQQKQDAPKFAFDTSTGGADGLAIEMMAPEGLNLSANDLTFTLKDVDSPPRVTRAPPVNYPFKAMSRGLEGRVFVRIRVGTDGKATNIRAERAEPPEVLDDFREEAEKAVSRYRFEPARLGGEAVPVWAMQPISFTLN